MYRLLKDKMLKERERDNMYSRANPSEFEPKLSALAASCLSVLHLSFLGSKMGVKLVPTSGYSGCRRVE